jgi:DNA-directed RNA polymerase subunit RPC12/RpoP
MPDEMLQLQCVTCGGQLEVSMRAIGRGREARCPACGTVAEIPYQATLDRLWVSEVAPVPSADPGGSKVRVAIAYGPKDSPMLTAKWEFDERQFDDGDVVAGARHYFHHLVRGLADATGGWAMTAEELNELEWPRQ